MSVYTFGSITVNLPDDLDIPSEAGNLSTDELKRLVSPPRGIGKACNEAAASLEQCNGAIAAPVNLTPELLRELGEKADKIDRILADIEKIKHTFMQANVMIDAEAFVALRRLYGMVKIESAFNPGLKKTFEPVYSYFAVYANSGSSTSSTASEEIINDTAPTSEASSEQAIA